MATWFILGHELNQEGWWDDYNLVHTNYSELNGSKKYYIVLVEISRDKRKW